ncbi:DUF1772 domain-containing protein [Pelagibacterium halotolerans]|uniref:anthrone oxygenase family protein n=1 Tax=Pelagibacterium halotolerans TaxID=531813 RepID=UPI00384B955D
MRRPLFFAASLSLVLTGAIFGFFYAWICSTLWGLDAADPSVAIAAMQAMNASVRNIVFAPVFFGTPVVLLITAWLAHRQGSRAVAMALVGAGVIYVFGGLVLTALVNVPMNQALANIHLPLDPGQAEAIWSAYSAPWQRWNIARTCASGAALLLTGYGIYRLGQDGARS